MKHLLTTHFSILCLLIFGTSYSQSDQQNMISVTGSAVETVVPDEVYFSLVLQEYNELGAKVELTTIEKDLIEIANRYGVKTEEIEIENLSAYQSYDYTGITLNKSYRIKSPGISIIESIVNELDDKAISSVSITYFSHSDSQIDEIRQKLREEALQEARTEAESVLNELGKQIIDVVGISVSQSQRYYNYGEPYRTPDSNGSKVPQARYLLVDYSVSVTYSYQ